MKLIVALCGALTVGACVTAGLTPEQLAMRAEFRQVVQDCQAKFALHVPRARCVNDADDKYMRPTYRYGDLLDVLEAERVAIATKIDAGQLSQADGQLEFAKARSELVSSEKARQNQEQMIQLQQAAVINSSLPVVCNTFGATTSCY
jgi:hypothetical protein